MAIPSARAKPASGGVLTACGRVCSVHHWSRALFLLLLALLAPGLPAQMPDVPGQLYDIDTMRLHMYCLGPTDSARPTVIFDAGLGGFSLEWLQIQRLLEPELHTCAYDRAGYGWSDPGPSPRTTSQINTEFTRLIEVVGLEPPYILVGHSFGGYNVQYYAKSNPDRVAGVVLVDSSHPEQAERIPDVRTREQRRPSRPRIVTHFNDTSVIEKFPADVRQTAMMILSSRKAVIAQQRELASFTYSGDEVDFLGDDFPDVPLVVVTRGQQQWPDNPLGISREKQWRIMQDELADLSINGHQIYAEHSGHMIHLDQPQLIADIILDMVRDRCDAAASC